MPVGVVPQARANRAGAIRGRTLADGPADLTSHPGAGTARPRNGTHVDGLRVLGHTAANLRRDAREPECGGEPAPRPRHSRRAAWLYTDLS